MPHSSKPTLLYYSEFSQDIVGMDDSFVEGVIKKELKAFFETIVVYYDRSADAARQSSQDNIVIPYRRRGHLIEDLSAFVDPNAIDLLVVRNTPAALRNALSNRRRYGYKVGFHPTFPHALRRLHEAELTGRALLRKRIEYNVRRFQLNRTTAKCDFVISSSEAMIESRRVRKNMKFFRLHNGVDKDLVPDRMRRAETQEGPLRFAYIGNFEIARQLDVVFRAFDELENDNWRIDIFSADTVRAAEVIRRSMRRRLGNIRIIPAVERATLFQELAQYDVGLCLIPTTPLFLVSSPLKMIEYYACGVPAIMTPLPACLEAFGNRGCGFFADFDPDSIKQAIRAVLSTDRSQLRRMGAKGRDFVVAERNYRKIATDLAEFMRPLGKLQGSH